MWVLIMLSLNNAKNKYNCSWHVKKNFWVHFTVLETQYISNTRLYMYGINLLNVSCWTCNKLFLKLNPDQKASSSTLIENACLQMSRDTRFPTMWYVRPAKAQNSLRIREYWSEPLLDAWIFYECKVTDWPSFGVSMLKRRLHRFVWV